MLQTEGFVGAAIGKRDSTRASNFIIKGIRSKGERGSDLRHEGAIQQGEQKYQESPAVALFQQLDRNGDGVITKEEFLTGLQQQPSAERLSAPSSHVIGGSRSSVD
jgi:Ca2+-binding EF-hand superfamily protein